MRRLAVAAFVLIVSALATHRAAHADDSWRPLFDLRLEPGVMIPAEHLQPKGAGGNPPPFYLGLTAETRLVGPVYASATGGVSFALGWVAGGAVSVSKSTDQRIRATIGVGPLLAPGAAFGSGTFAQVDATVQVRPIGAAAFIVIAGELAVALNHAGVMSCGTDTCTAYLKPGDLVAGLRVGLGYAF